MKKLKWITLLLICTLYFFACKKNDLTPVKSSNLVTVTLDGQKIDLLKKGDKYYFYDDVVFDQKTVDSFFSLSKTDQRVSTKPRSAMVGFTNLAFTHWTNSTIYYTIAPGFTSAQEQVINDAIDHWRNNTTLKFIQRTNQYNYVTFTWGGNVGNGGVSDWIGMKGGQQNVTLFGSFDFAIVHEIGHVAGLFHEQSRADRDNFITINWNNIGTDANSRWQFQTYNQQGRPGIDHGTFDFNSVMLYSSSDGSINGFPTMVRASDGSQFSGSTGLLSAGDIASVNYFYGAPYAKLRTTPAVPSIGYTTADSLFVDLYSDEACTIPYILTTPRLVALAQIGSGYDEYGSATTYGRHTATLTPNSTNSFFISTDLVWYSEEITPENYRREWTSTAQGISGYFR